jgi:Ca2+-binding RTX toxin-like protein
VNTFVGGAGNDTYGYASGSVDAGGGNDYIFGYPTYNGSTYVANHFQGGDGNDTIYYVDNAGDVVSEESTGAGINDGGGDRVISTVDFTLGNFLENLNLSGAGNISGTGNGLNNGLNGNSGNNTLTGLGGADTLNGGDGADTLIGGSGNDVLNGGTGADTFVFAAAGAPNGVDTVQDFVHGTDQLLFTGSDYGFAAGHLLTASEFTAGSAAVGAGAQFVWDAATHTLYWDHDGAGGDAAVAIATFGGGATLTASDFHFG